MNELSQRKYNYMRAQHLNKQDNGVSLMPETDTPEMPVWGKDKTLPPEIQQRLEQMDKGENIPPKGDQPEGNQ